MVGYITPAPEGPIPQDPRLIRRFYQEDFPFEIGSLERNAFTHLGDWHVYMDNDGYGMAHRLGIKNYMWDHEGDPMFLLLHFGSTVARRGVEFNQESLERVYLKFQMAIEKVRVLIGAAYYNVVSIGVKPPEYMIRELEEMLK